MDREESSAFEAVRLIMSGYEWYLGTQEPTLQQSVYVVYASVTKYSCRICARVKSLRYLETFSACALQYRSENKAEINKSFPDSWSLLRSHNIKKN